MESVAEQFLKKLEYMKNKYAKKMLLTKKSEAEYENSDKEMCDIFNRRVGNLNVADGYNCEKCKNRGGFMRLTEDGYPVFRKCTCANTREMIKNLKDSGLADYITKYSFENYIATEPWQEELKKSAMAFVKDTENNWFFVGGQSGAGKTHICTAITAEFLRQGKKAYYMLWRDEATKIKSLAAEGEKYEKAIFKLKTINVLYIDDLFKMGKDQSGKVQRPTTADINLAFELINYRYNKKNLITVISSERNISEIMEIDEAIGGRIFELSSKKNYAVNISNNPSKNYRRKAVRVI